MLMFLCILLVLCCIIGIVECLVIQRVIDHMRDNPEAAKLVAEHVIAPIMSGKPVQEAREIFGSDRETTKRGRPS